MRSWLIKSVVFGLLIILIAIPTEKKKDASSAKAASLSAYPSFCLGGWENPNNASGMPEVQPGDDSFSNANSAVLDQKAAQMFCGYFQSVDKSYEPTQVTLRFSWKMEFQNQVAPTNPTDTDTDSKKWSDVLSGQSSTTSTASSTTPIETPPLISTSTEINATSSASTTPPVSDLPQNSSSSPVMTGPSTTPSFPTSTDTATSTAPVFSSTPSAMEKQINDWFGFFVKKVLAQTINPSADFLDIIYSLDGKNLQSIARINEGNWKNLTVTIPISSWDDISKLQIQLSPIPTVDMPKIYLDGMWLDVNYNHSIIDSIKDEANAVLDATKQAGDAVSAAMDTIANGLTDAVNSVLKPNTAEIVAPNAQNSENTDHPKPRLSFAIQNSLPVYIKELPWKPTTESKDEKGQTNSVPPPNIASAGDPNSFAVNGTCAKEYFTVLLFRNQDDYANDPSTAIFNKAFRCANGNFNQTFTDQDFPSNLPDGNYYLVTGDQGTRGTWQPHSLIQIITINRNNSVTSSTTP